MRRNGPIETTKTAITMFASERNLANERPPRCTCISTKIRNKETMIYPGASCSTLVGGRQNMQAKVALRRIKLQEHCLSLLLGTCRCA